MKKGQSILVTLYTYTHLQNLKVSKTEIYTISKDECVSIFSSSIEGVGWGGAAVELIQNIYSKILLILYSLFLSTNKFRRLSFFFFQNYDARAKVSFSIIYSKIKLYKHRKHINHAHTHLRIKITSINTFYVA